MQDISFEHGDLLKKVNGLMLNPNTLLLASKISKLANLCARPRSQTCWSSAFDMLVRYHKIHEHLHLFDCEDVDSLAFNTAEDPRVNDLFERLENL